jgi:hypothetical protein
MREGATTVENPFVMPLAFLRVISRVREMKKGSGSEARSRCR